MEFELEDALSGVHKSNKIPLNLQSTFFMVRSTNKVLIDVFLLKMRTKSTTDFKKPKFTAPLA